MEPPDVRNAMAGPPPLSAVSSRLLADSSPTIVTGKSVDTRPPEVPCIQVDGDLIRQVDRDVAPGRPQLARRVRLGDELGRNRPPGRFRLDRPVDAADPNGPAGGLGGHVACDRFRLDAAAGSRRGHRPLGIADPDVAARGLGNGPRGHGRSARCRPTSSLGLVLRLRPIRTSPPDVRAKTSPSRRSIAMSPPAVRNSTSCRYGTLMRNLGCRSQSQNRQRGPSLRPRIVTTPSDCSNSNSRLSGRSTTTSMPSRSRLWMSTAPKSVSTTRRAPDAASKVRRTGSSALAGPAGDGDGRPDRKARRKRTSCRDYWPWFLLLPTCLCWPYGKPRANPRCLRETTRYEAKSWAPRLRLRGWGHRKLARLATLAVSRRPVPGPRNR